MAARREAYITVNIYCGCGTTLDATYTNNIVNYIAGQDWNVPSNTGFTFTQGDVVGFICNNQPITGYWAGAEYQLWVQHLVTGGLRQLYCWDMGATERGLSLKCHMGRIYDKYRAIGYRHLPVC
jgi:hypothetical protein